MTSPKPGRFIALSYPDFRAFWVGQLISTIGSQMMIVGLNWHIYVLTKSAFALGLIGLMRFIPILIFALIGGGFADAHNRKKVQYVTLTIFAMLSLTLMTLTMTNQVTPLHIYVLTALMALTMTFDMPARQAFVPNLVERKHLANAMSLNSIVWQTAMIVGPAVAGFMIAHLGIASIYLVDAFSFTAVIIALLVIKADGKAVGGHVEFTLTSVKEGLHFVTSKTLIWSTMLLDFFSTFFSGAYALMPIFATQILNVGPEGLGILYAAPSLGAVIAGVIMAHFHEIKKQGLILLTSVGVYGLATVFFGISQWYALSLLALFFIGAGDSISTIIRNTIRQLATPDNMRGRMTAINMVFFMGGPQLGEFEAGMLATLLSAPASVALGGVGTMLVVGLMAYLVPTLRKFETHES